MRATANGFGLVALKPLYKLEKKIMSLAKPLLDRAIFLSWNTFGRSPKLNLGLIQDRYVQGNPESGGNLPIQGGRLLVHIAFHYSIGRFHYLDETIKAIKLFPFHEIDIVIDTNTTKTEKILSTRHKDVRFVVWNDLEDPFKLTWMHRRQMMSQLGQYDAFLYVEDDICIPPQVIESWLRNKGDFEGSRYLQGYIRVEHNRDGDLVLSDFMNEVAYLKPVKLGDRTYVESPFPYQGFWLYSAEQMRAFVQLDCYLEGAAASPHKWQYEIGVREAMAFGMVLTDSPDGFNSRALIQVEKDGSISRDVLVYHLPSNYGRRRLPHKAGLGTIKLEDWRKSDEIG